MLLPGTRLGSYEIVGLLGAGGMGEVYRARDTRLKRDVAIKLLPATFAADPDRLSRFEREAQLLASLNHPNIGTIHGFEESGGIRALVLELVEGQTLAERIADGPIPVDEAISIAKQIALALESAHDRGIVHRDLKPANVKCTLGGTVKVLDFGLAKALDPAVTSDGAEMMNSPTLTDRATQLGVVLGTAAYMSPEQARGRAVDKRADVWAFGVVLYEMLTGRRAFDGDNTTDVMARVITSDPPWTALPEHTPPALRRLLERCLRKDPSRRLHHIADARLELDEALEASAPAAASPSRPSRSTARALLALGAAFLLVGIGGFLLGGGRAPLRRTATDWQGERLAGSTVAMGPHVSPDGQMIAFQAMVDGMTQVAVMRPQSGNWTVLTNDRSLGLAQEMCWSRDGSRIYFDRMLDVPTGVFTVPVLGGDERLLLDNAMTPQVLPDGSLLVMRINSERLTQLHRFWPETGRVDALPALAAPLSRLPNPALRVFPDGREAVFVGRPVGNTEPDHLWVIDIASGRTRRIAPDARMAYGLWSFPLAVASDDRSVLFIAPQGNLQHVVMAPRDGSSGLQTLLTLTQRPVALDIGPDGSLYADQLDQPAEILRYVPSTREEERIPLPATHDEGPVLPLRDGRLLVATQSGGRERIMVMTAGKEPVPFIDTQEETAAPMAALGADRVVFLAGTRPGRKIAVASAVNGRIVSRLTGADGNQLIGGLAGTPDGATIYFTAGGMLWSVPASDGEPRPLRGADSVAVSPDGRELIVLLNEATGIRLVRRALPSGEEREVPIRDDVRLTPWPIAPNAVARDGRIAIRVTTRNTWFWPAAILDPETGKVEFLPNATITDMLTPGWDAQDRVVTVSLETRGTLWRFQSTALR